MLKLFGECIVLKKKNTICFPLFSVQLQISCETVNLHELAIGPANRATVWSSESAVTFWGRKMAFAASAHHCQRIPLRKTSDVMAPAKKQPLASGKGFGCLETTRAIWSGLMIARHAFRIMDDVSCFMLPRSHQETQFGEIKMHTYSKSDCCSVSLVL